MNELMTRESGQMAALFRMLEHALDHIEVLTENYRPVLGGERYLTDREVAKLLKTCRRTLQEYRDAGRMPYIQLGGENPVPGIGHRAAAGRGLSGGIPQRELRKLWGSGGNRVRIEKWTILKANHLHKSGAS